MEERIYSLKWYNSILDIGLNKEEWNNIYCNESIFKQYDFMFGIENSILKDVTIKYLVILSNNRIIGILPCFNYKLELDVVANKFVKKSSSFIRKFFPNFFKLNIFCIGSPVATCVNHIAFIKDFELLKDDKSLGNLVFDELKVKYQETKSSLLMVKEIPLNELQLFKDFFKDTFHIFESLPNSFIPIFNEDLLYPNILVKKYRNRIKRSYNIVEKLPYKWKIITDFSTLVDEVYVLYLNVYNNSSTKFEKLTKDFFKQMNLLGDKSYLLTCYDDNKLICAELIIEDDDAIIPMYLGLDYTFTRNKEIYNNVIFRTIKIAEQKNKKWIIFGQTSYLAKAYSGALFEKLYFAFYSNNLFVNFLLKYIFKYLFPSFNKPDVSSIQSNVVNSDIFKERLEKSGITFENL
ncbi:hypothetical protein [Myroides marinus]|uniref:hypothetical protein n=1 Tax=Myroides marinus TaxID=703342 RepID=UPI002576BAD0|nr:hypothetical protein [Myroides marinus]MDM1380695.1 hypothetical protein [Myroides marinus]MDM1387991.1 hypothetical protein [Myroides marinus]MDM1395179.1 hypothetical protein [Myroides marinus]